MKILLIGPNGTLGKAVAKELGARHEIIGVSRNSGKLTVDITSAASISSLYNKIGPVDAVACCAGGVHFGPLQQMTEKEMLVGIRDKLMGQINLVLIGQAFVRDQGSFTLISGILADSPVRYGAAASTVNSALHGFVLGAAIELPRAQRINVVCPGVFAESMDKYGPYFRGHEPVAAERVALAFSRSVEGAQTGQIYRV